jgi:hypothetical protein
LESAQVEIHQLVIPTSIGHLCGAVHTDREHMAISISTRGNVEPFHAMDVLARQIA